MKLPGLEVMLVILLTLPIVWFGGGVLASMKKAELENDTKFLALEFATVLNIIQSAPDNTNHRFELLSVNCEIQITETEVKVILRPTGFGIFEKTAELLQTDTTIGEKTITCEEFSEKVILIEKNNNEIKIIEE